MKRSLRWPVLIFFLIAVVLTAVAFALDGLVQQWIANHQTPGVTTVMRFASRWGDWPPHVVVGLVAAGISWALGQREWTKIFVAMILACALAGIVSPIVKNTAGRARPGVKVSAGWNGPNSGAKYHSFPSGHTIATSAFFGVLVLARRRVGFALLPIPLLIAFSRLYLNAHFLSDVVCGAVLGMCCAVIVWRLVDRALRSSI